jgi:hypothetical protein
MSARSAIGALPAWVALLIIISAVRLNSQTNYNERVFPQSKAAIEKALKALQPALAGRLPVLDGFAKPAERPLDRYQRGYYQALAEVNSNASGGSLVRIRTKLTAWYNDPSSAASGYQLLVSNGRIEEDILDRLAEKLEANSPGQGSPPGELMTPAKGAADAEPPSPVPATPFPSSIRALPPPPASTATEHAADARPAAKSSNPLQAEINSLEEILKNTAHPKNLVAVRKSGTPVVATPSLTAKPQFLASLHDEFELLDFNADWVHVRISGLSRGWIWRNSVEMPDGIADTAAPSTTALAPAADLFRVLREEIAQFPGDWEPLRSKPVKIISVQNIDESAKNSGPTERLAYTKFLLEKSYKELAQKPVDFQGVVIIFDAADGGMIAAKTATLRDWIAGTLSDSALWHKCFFDPPEVFDSSGSSASN